MIVAEDVDLSHLEWDAESPPCESRDCKHESIARATFRLHPTCGWRDRWYLICQTHLDRARGRVLTCNKCEGRLALLDFRTF